MPRFPKYFILTETLSKDDIVAIVNQDENALIKAIKANEVKSEVMCFQRCPEEIAPLSATACRPHRKKTKRLPLRATFAKLQKYFVSKLNIVFLQVLLPMVCHASR